MKSASTHTSTASRSTSTRTLPWWGVWSVGTLATFLLASVWSVTMPIYSGPDESSQAIHAAALVRGQIIGTPVNRYEDPYTLVTVPGTFALGGMDSSCFLKNPAIPASCAAGVRLSSRPVGIGTYSGRYPPLYYVAPGLVTLVDQSPDALIFMRLAGALMCSVLLGLTLMAISLWSRRRMLSVGLLCALPPTAVYLFSMVNPNGLEIAAAICLWCSGLVLVLERLDDPPRGLVLVVTVSAVVLICTRGLSPLYAVLILAALGALAGPAAIRRLFGRRDIRRAALVLVVVGAGAVTWVLAAHALWLLPSGPSVGPHASDVTIIAKAFAQTHAWLEQMVGVLGWDETYMPTWTYRIWAVVVILLVLIAVRSRERRALLVLASLIALSLLLPVVLSLPQARIVGIAWQGRYTLPLAVGVPLLAAWLGGTAGNAPHPRIRLALVLALACASVLGYLETLRRYAVGTRGPIYFFGGPWHPVEGWALALVWYVAGYGLLCAVLWRLVEARGDTDQVLQLSYAGAPTDGRQ